MSNAGPGVRRRQLRFRSWHRGTREADLLLGTFADAHLDAFTTEQLDRYAALLENSDPDIYDWVTGRAPVPPEHDNDVMHLLRNTTFAGRRP
jgi:antitoxin CptB